MTTSSPKTILVTGANGFIGSHILKKIHATPGLNALGMVRPTSNLDRLNGEKVKLVTASLPENPGDSLAGVDTIIHTAGLSTDWGTRKEFFRANLDGTTSLLHHAIKQGVRRFIHFSSVVVYGFDGFQSLPETAPLKPFPHNYCLSKTAAESEVTSRSAQIETIILRPSNVYGPGDYTTTFPLFSALEKGLFFFPEGGKTITSPCYVENLVEATMLALKTQAGLGQAYNITDGQDLPWKDFLSLAARELGTSPPRWMIPSQPLYFLGVFLEKIFTLARAKNPPLITPYRIAQVRKDYGFSIEKSKRVLKYYPPFSLKEGLSRSVEWFRSFQNLRNEKTAPGTRVP